MTDEEIYERVIEYADADPGNFDTAIHELAIETWTEVDTLTSAFEREQDRIMNAMREARGR